MMPSRWEEKVFEENGPSLSNFYKLKKKKRRNLHEKAQQTKAYLNFKLVECFSIVDINNACNHLRHNYHVSEVGPYWPWLLSRRSILFLHIFSYRQVKTLQLLMAVSEVKTYSRCIISHCNRYMISDLLQTIDKNYYKLNHNHLSKK